MFLEKCINWTFISSPPRMIRFFFVMWLMYSIFGVSNQRNHFEHYNVISMKIIRRLFKKDVSALPKTNILIVLMYENCSECLFLVGKFQVREYEDETGWEKECWHLAKCSSAIFCERYLIVFYLLGPRFHIKSESFDYLSNYITVKLWKEA